MPSGRKVDDRQPAVTEGHTGGSVDPNVSIIWSTMPQCLSHVSHAGQRCLVSAKDARNAAHGL
jgi:hypothetical protein